jgi:hypothetical protein
MFTWFTAAAPYVFFHPFGDGFNLSLLAVRSPELESSHLKIEKKVLANIGNLWYSATNVFKTLKIKFIYLARPYQLFPNDNYFKLL